MPTLIVPPPLAGDAAVEADADGDAPVGLDPVGAGLAQALSNMLVPNAAEPYSRNLRLPN